MSVLSDVVVNVLINALTGVVIGVAPALAVAGADVNVSADVMTALEFALSAPFEEYMLFGWTAFSGCPMDLFDRDRALQALIPSDHV